jgi:hypothetical protein
MKIRPVGAVLFHVGGRTDGEEEITNYESAQKYGCEHRQ